MKDKYILVPVDKFLDCKDYHERMKIVVSSPRIDLDEQTIAEKAVDYISKQYPKDTNKSIACLLGYTQAIQDILNQK